MNTVSVIGRLAKDPELRHTPAGMAVCELRIAVDRAGPKGGDGTYGPGWFSVTLWDKQAENAAMYLVKGQQVGVSGELRYHEWETDDGQKRSKVDINARWVDFLARAGEGRGDAAASRADDFPTSSQGDDIPF